MFFEVSLKDTLNLKMLFIYLFIHSCLKLEILALNNYLYIYFFSL